MRASVDAAAESVGCVHIECVLLAALRCCGMEGHAAVNLPRKRAAGPRRKVHPIRPVGEVQQPEPIAAPISERADPEYRATVERIRVYAGGACQAGLDRCTRTGQHPHHVYPISEGGRVLVPDRWLIWVCPQCHHDIHDASTRQAAEAAGLIVPKERKPT